MTTSPVTLSSVTRAVEPTMGDDGDGIVEAFMDQPFPQTTQGGGAKRQKVDTPFPWSELHSLPTRQLQVMSRKAFALLDSHYPPFGALDQYQALVDELDERRRAAQSAAQSGVNSSRSAAGFRDNPLSSRFELFVDGTLVGYLKYWVQGGQVVLQETVVTALLEDGMDAGIEETLIRRTMFNAHKRRLGLQVRCPRVLSFLTDNPQFQRFLSAHSPSTSTP